MIRIAQASSSEFHSAWGEPGNQRRTAAGDDGELNIIDIRDAGAFTTLFRWKDRGLAARAADLAVRVVKNEKVGYSQNNGAAPRTSLIQELRACHWRPEDIKSKCNCDCSSLMMTVLRYNDLDSISEDMWTGDQCQQMRRTGAFEEIRIGAGMVYQVGDILWRSGHTAIVCETDQPADAEIWYCDAANIRKNPVNGAVIGELHAGDQLQLLAQNAWYYVRDIRTGKEGWVSAAYVRKK